MNGDALLGLAKTILDDKYERAAQRRLGRRINTHR